MRTLPNGRVMALRLLVVGSMLAPIHAAAAAQTGAPESPAGLADIIVTARRVEENQQRVPLAVTTLTSAAIQQRNVRSIADLQFNVPNLQIKPSQNYPSIPEFVIRGQRQQLYTDENVVTYVNGVPQGTRGLTLYDLESVQALKGPQGTLFGKNSNGGAMVFTTMRPSFHTEGSVELEYGNYNRRVATGVLNLPIIDDKVAVRLAGRIERRDGTFENVYATGKDLDNRHDDSARLTLLAKPGERLENLLTLDYLRRDEIPNPSVLEAAALSAPGFTGAIANVVRQAVKLQSELGGAEPVVADGLLVRRGDPFRVDLTTGIGTTTPPLNPLNTNGILVKTYGLANTTSFTIDSALTLRNILGYRYERSIDEQVPAGLSGFTLNIAPILTALGGKNVPPYVGGQVALSTTNYFNRTRTFSDELQLVGNLTNFKFILGGFYSHTNFIYAVTSYLAFGPVNLRPRLARYADEYLKTDSSAVFAQGTYDFSGVGLDGLRLTLGARYTWDKKDYVGDNFYSPDNSLRQFWPIGNGVCNEISGTSNGVTAVNSATQCSISGKRTFKALTWTDSLEYQATPSTLLYFTNRRGYKAGGANPTTVNKDFAFFGPERLTDFEIGLKHQGLLGSIPYRFNIDGFIGKYEKIQTQDILTFCATNACTGTFTDLIIFNVGKATIKGLELETSIKPVPELTLDLGYSYQVGRYGKGSRIPQPTSPGPIGPNNPIDYAGGVNLDGVEFAGVPRHTLNVAATYEARFIPASFARTLFSMNYAYRSDGQGLRALGIYKTPGFGILSGRLAFNDIARSTISLAVWAQNITNKFYRLSCADALASIGYATCRWGDPRTYGVTGSVRF